MLTIRDHLNQLWPRFGWLGTHHRLPRLDAMGLSPHAIDDLNLPASLRGRLESDRLRSLYDRPLGRI